MKKNFNFTLKQITGEDIADGDTKFTAKKAVVDSLCAPDMKKKLSGTQYVEQYDLAIMVHEAEGEVELTPEQITHIKTAIADNYLSPVIVGQMHKYLNE